MDKQALAGFQEAQAITKKYAKTFYLASLLLSKEKRNAAYSVYAVCRISDETVDNFKTANKIGDLSKLKERINGVFNGHNFQDNILSAFKETIDKYNIPKEYFDELMDGMLLDLNQTRYNTFGDLNHYCYKVAGVIGLIMLKIFGYADSRAQEYAIKIGVAMQLTNIIRDIKEDSLRGRIYLPQDEMREFGVTESDITQGKINENLKSLLKYQLNRAKDYYKSGEQGINLITDKRSRFVALIMKEMYAGILSEVEKNNYNIFSKRAHLNLPKKLLIVFKEALRRNA